MKCMKLLSKPGTGFCGSRKCTKLVMDEMYEIRCKISKASTDYCVVPNSRMSYNHIQIFFSLQVKRSVIISNKHGIYELHHELPNDLRLRILGN